MEQYEVINTPIEETFEGSEQFREQELPVLIGNEVQIDPTEIDDELGLPIVNKPSIKEKYDIDLDPHTNNFHRSLCNFYDANGYLTPKQLKCFQ